MKIAIIGAGYVGTGVALAWARKHDVCFYDTDLSKIKSISEGEAPIDNQDVKRFFFENKRRIFAAESFHEACEDASSCFICVPTPLDAKTGKLNDEAVIRLLSDLSILKNAKSLQIFIRSTMNLSDAKMLSKEFSGLNIHCMPEFLREAHLYEDALNPTRIVIGGTYDEECRRHMEVYVGCLDNDPEILNVTNEEAMAIKLLSNSYLATRVAFFNEVDSLCVAEGMNSGTVIKGVSLDARIGDYYNKPSSGFGGKCLPKDLLATSQAMKEANIEHSLLEAVHLSNEERKNRGK